MEPAEFTCDSNHPVVHLIKKALYKRRLNCLNWTLELAVLTFVFLPLVVFAQSAPTAATDPQQKFEKLEEKLNSQQQEIDALRLELKQALRDQQNVKNQSVQTTVQPAPVAQPSEAVVAASAQTAKVEPKDSKRDGSESPLAIHYKNLAIIPGGFLAAESVFRTRNENADMGSDFANLPFDGTANAHLSEFHMSARATRPSVMLKTEYKGIKITGFEEFDGYGVTAANEVKSNSFSPRQRQLWIRLDNKNGWSFTAGQMWSLMVRHSQGMQTGQEDSAPGDIIEGSFILGHVWERQTGYRIVKNFNDKVWVGFAAENPQTTYSSTNIPLYMFGLNTSTNATSSASDVIAYSSGVADGVSTDLAPDLIAKVAFEPGRGHYELKGIYRFFRTRENGVTYKAYGAGLGVSAKYPLIKSLDFAVEGLAGEGIGRYSSGGGPDITLHPDGSPVPVKQLHTSAGFEYHTPSKFSAFAYAGNEYYQRAAYVNSNGLGVGYGSTLTNNSQCEVEVPGYELPTCTAQNRDIQQAVGGFWYTFFKGPFGTFKYGMNYEHLKRNTWHAVGGQPTGQDDIVMTSFRFVLP